MKIKLLCTSSGLIPMYDDDYDNKKKLKVGESYTATITVARNIKFHRKYFAMINTAYDYLTEKQQQAFRSRDAFRKQVQTAAGFYEPVWSIKHNEFLEYPKSIAFDKMDEKEFSEVYDRVLDVITALLVQCGRPVEEYNRIIQEFT